MTLKKSYSWRDYWPLIAIAVTALVAGAVGWLQTSEIMRSMSLFMGTGLLLLASLKTYNVSEFAMAFARYDLLAKRSDTYARWYPFLELVLAVGYLAGAYLLVVNIVTFVVMTIGAVGVYQKMHDEEVLMCACLGAVFDMPMTWVTLTEDSLMAVMAGIMTLVLLV
jgi:hypothetical protein